MNVFLLPPILDCVSEIECGEMSETVRALKKVKTVKLSGARCCSRKSEEWECLAESHIREKERESER